MVINKAAVCITLILCVCACTSNNKSALSDTVPQSSSLRYNHWVSLPQRDALVVIGVSGRQIKPEMEIDVAREDAARKIAMYYGVQVVSETVQDIGSGFLDYYVDSQINIEHDQEFEKYMDGLNFDPERDVVNDDGVVFVRFTYPVVFPETITYSSTEKNQNGSPEWTTRPPQNIGSFMVGVGHSGRQLRVRDTILKSYESAAAALVSQLSTFMETRDLSDSGAYQNRSVIIRKSEGELRNFTVIETWIDPESLAVWTLAIAQNAY